MQVLWTETADTTEAHEHFLVFMKFKQSLGRSTADRNRLSGKTEHTPGSLLEAQRIEAHVARAELVVHAHRRLDPVAPGEGVGLRLGLG